MSVVKRALAVTGGVVFALLSASSAEAEYSRVDPGVISVNLGMGIDGSGSQVGEPSIARIEAMGITHVRLQIYFGNVYDGPSNPLDFSQYDEVVRDLANHDITVDPILGYSNSAYDAAAMPRLVPTTEPGFGNFTADFVAYATDVAERYGPGGSFWDEETGAFWDGAAEGATARPMTRFEVWNEEDSGSFWNASPARYGVLYDAVREAIHVVTGLGTPDVTVSVGGLTNSGSVTTNFLEDMQPAPGPWYDIDAVGFHPYVAPATARTAVRDLRAWLDDHGYGATVIDVNEFGGKANENWFDNNPLLLIPPPFNAGAMSDAARGVLIASITQDMLQSNCGIRTVAPFAWEKDYTHNEDDAWYGLYVSPTNPRNDHNAEEVSAAAQAYGNRIGLLTGVTGSAPRATTRFCGVHELPDADGDTVPDEDDPAPVDGTVPAPNAPTDAAPTAYESPVYVTALPAVMQAGQDLKATHGTWNGSPVPAFSFQWERCSSPGSCAPIVGATADTYTTTASDVSKTIRATVTAVNSQGSATASTATTATVWSLPTMTSTSVTLTGPTNPPHLGQAVGTGALVFTGYPTPTPGYQWYRCGSMCYQISGATGSSYTPTVFDLGSRLMVDAWAQNAVGASGHITSSPTPQAVGL